MPTTENKHYIGTKGFGLALKVAQESLQKPLVLVGRNKAHASTLLRDLRFIFQDDASSNLLYLPPNDSTPYQSSSPNPLLIKERMATLFKLASGENFKVLVTTPGALISKTLPLDALLNENRSLSIDEEINREALLNFLAHAGYHAVNRVEDPGTFALRGSIIDIFWPGAKEPIRIDLFGDTIERLHFFNPETQRTTSHVTHFSFGPVKEFFFTNGDKIEERLRDLADEVEYPTKKLKEILGDIGNSLPFFGIEALLPAFFEALESPLEIIAQLFSRDEIHFAFDDLGEVINNIGKRNESYSKLYESAKEQRKLVYEPQAYLNTTSRAKELFEAFGQINFADLSLTNTPNSTNLGHKNTQDLRRQILSESTTDKDSGTHSLFKPLADVLKQNLKNHITTLIPLSSPGSVQQLKNVLEPLGIGIRVAKQAPTVLDAQRGFNTHFNQSVHAILYASKYTPPETGVFIDSKHFALISEDDIFGKRTRRQTSSGKSSGFQTTLSDLNEGDFIVHVEHGVGVFQGLKKLSVRGIEQDYALLTYAKEDKLYLPVQHINLIQPYQGMGAGTPKIDKLGGTAWGSKKAKVKASVLAMAQELLNLYAKRDIVTRPPFDAPSEEYWDFESRFGFETTPDQQKAIDDVLRDMQSKKPMDRLVCGDVGYGKTEVAMRAAMMALLSGKQVAVLAPTTVLAQQHTLVFKERFKHTGAVIKAASRFQKKQEVVKVLKDTAEGRVDVLIGTHRLLSDDVNFKDLGLVIVDEEQRFGIKAKERLKRLKTKADFITMSATPIPRTLQMSFLGIRDLSIIETPPVDRLAIRTAIMRFDDAVIREGILRELGRQGQVYFVHNRVKTIDALKEYLEKLVPEAKIEIGHGQMPERDLEDVMVRFVNQEFNVLLCTTIIETGIDVPTANTMFVDHADDFGLSQLYQLRGRIGRSNQRAFANLLVPNSTEHLTPIAKRRLEIINEFSELGAGFRIAQHDLELRGAGDLLGKSQHGHVASVGYDLYVDLLKTAVNEIKGKGQEELVDPDINLPLRAFIPEDYAVDLHERLGFYQKLATAENEGAIYDVLGEIEDMLGEPPEEVTNLAEVMVLKERLRRIKGKSLVIPAPKDESSSPSVFISVVNESKKITFTPDKADWESKFTKDYFKLAKAAIALAG